MVEICGTLPSEFQMLTLVFANRNMCCSIKISFQEENITDFVWITHLWTKMSAACNTGYEKRPSFNIDLVLALNGDVLGANCNLLYDMVSKEFKIVRSVVIKFQPSIESCVIDIPSKQCSSESTLTLYALEPVDNHEQVTLLRLYNRMTH
jgi:hypothetical protein